MLQVFPLFTVVVPTELPFLYSVMVAEPGLVASILLQVPVTEILLPAAMGLVNTGAVVHTALTPLKPETVMVGCALTTDCHAAATFALAASSMP